MKMPGRIVRALDWGESWATTRGLRKTEKQAWRRGLPEEMHPLPDDNDEDPSGRGDCRHGCNGECGPGSKCVYGCHPQEVYDYWERKRDA